MPSIPLLAIICKSCPESKEATFYAVFVSIANFFCSLANLTGFLFLDLMDVTATSYKNVNAVNVLCTIWAIMLFNFLFHIKFPDQQKVKKNKFKVDWILIWRHFLTKQQSVEYSEPQSEDKSD